MAKKWEVLVTISGWGKTIIEADTEEEVREIFDDGDWELTDDQSEYEIETIEPEGSDQERLQRAIDAGAEAMKKAKEGKEG